MNKIFWTTNSPREGVATWNNLLPFEQSPIDVRDIFHQNAGGRTTSRRVLRHSFALSVGIPTMNPIVITFVLIMIVVSLHKLVVAA